MRRRTMMATVAFTPALAGCGASFLDVIDKVLGGLGLAQHILNYVDEIVQSHFAGFPDEKAQRDYLKAKAVTDESLALVTKLASAGESAVRGDVDAAFEAFRDAYAELLDLLAELGFQVMFPEVDAPMAGARGGMPELRVPRPGELELVEQL